MALYSVQTGAVALSASATKSMWLLNPADDKVKIVEVTVSMDGSAAATAPRVDLYRVTTLGSPAGTTGTLVKVDPADAAGETTAVTALTTEPTAVEIIDSFYLPQSAGPIKIQYPFGREPVAAAAGSRIGLRIVTPAAVTPNAISSVIIEE
jgi:hypothetical protein